MPHSQRRRTGSAKPPNPAKSTAAGRASESKIRSDEIYRMAAFRIRETAKRVSMLANSATDEPLRSDLLAICERLLEEERILLEAAKS